MVREKVLFMLRAAKVFISLPIVLLFVFQSILYYEVSLIQRNIGLHFLLWRLKQTIIHVFIFIDNDDKIQWNKKFTIH